MLPDDTPIPYMLPTTPSSYSLSLRFAPAVLLKLPPSDSVAGDGVAADDCDPICRLLCGLGVPMPTFPFELVILMRSTKPAPVFLLVTPVPIRKSPTPDHMVKGLDDNAFA